MRTKHFSAGLLALSLGGLLLVGAGCGSQSTADAGEGRPGRGAAVREGEGRPDYVPAREKRSWGDRDEDDAPSAAPAAPIDETGAREIKLTATRFAFEPAEIKVKQGEKIKLTLTNADGRHGIAIPALNVSLRLKEGETGSVVFVADKAGTYPFFCNVFCGEGHRDMHGTLIVE